MLISDEHLATIRRHSLFADLLDSNGIVDNSVLDKLRLNVCRLLETDNCDRPLLALCRDVIFHDNMKAYALHQLISLYIEMQEDGKEDSLPARDDGEEAGESGEAMP